MRIIDFHLHIGNTPDVAKELNIGRFNYTGLLQDLSCNLKKARIEKGMVILLDTAMLTVRENVLGLKNLISGNKINNLLFSCTVDFRNRNMSSAVDAAVFCGIKGIKFHPIHQKIMREDFKRVKAVARLAQQKGLLTIIDCHYVGFDSGKYSGLELAKHILPEIKSPVILAHSGGLKVLEALILALEYKNVYLETSFSVPFWLGSSIEQDFVFLIKKAGANRCIYGSDAPFIDLRVAKKETEVFLRKHHFTEREMESMFFHTANSLL